MLLWRIASKTIPVKEILDQRMGLDNQVCALCQEAPKTSCHLFYHCPIARAIWFTSCWGMRVHDHNLTNSADIIKLVLNPPIPSAQEVDREHITTTLAFTLDEIWLLRNQFTFEDSKIDSLSSSNRISRRVAEFSNLHNLEVQTIPPASPTSWSPPPADTIKLNVDATVGSTSTALTVLARDHTEIPIKLWVKKHISCLPIQAEVTSVFWAINLASTEGWTRIIIEGDSKICFDTLTVKDSLLPLTISNIVSDVISVSRCWSILILNN